MTWLVLLSAHLLHRKTEETVIVLLALVQLELPPPSRGLSPQRDPAKITPAYALLSA